MNTKITMRIAAFPAAMIGLSAIGAAAQPAPATTAGPTLETIVVTAENRAAAAQKTAISMSVYNSRAIRANNIHDAQSLARIDPSLKFESQLGGASTLAIRGISSQDTTEIGDPAVSIATDNFFVNRLVAVNATLYDIARIEVLRGPQGTLYGRNSVGGDVNIITARPAPQPSGAINVEYGNYNATNIDGYANLPVTDTVQVRAAFTSRTHQGYRDNPGFGRGDDEDTRSGRVSIKAEPTADLTLWAQVQYTHEGGVGPVATGFPFTFIDGPLPGGGFGPIEISHALPAGINPNRFPIYAPFGLDIADTKMEWEGVYTGLAWGLRLTYRGGLDLLRDNEVADSTALTPPAPPPLIPSPFTTHQRPATQNHELLLASPGSGRLTWQTGLFYFAEDNSVDSPQTLLNGDVAGGTPQIRFLLPTITTRSYAAFAQGSYAITPALKLTLGGRETHDTKSRVGAAYIYPELFGIPPSVMDPTVPIVVNSDNGRAAFSKFTWTAGLDWQLAAHNFAYVKVNTGYKSGGFNSNGFSTAIPYGPETVTNYEIGSKNRFDDDRIEINAAAFYDDYKGYQAQVFSCTLCSNPQSGIQNAGSARIFGLETEFAALAQPIGQFTLRLAYLNARFTQFQAGLLNYATGASENVNFTGRRLIQAPDLTVNAALEHDWDLPAQTELAARIQTTFQTKQYFSFQNTPDTLQGPYTVSDATLTFRAPARHYEVGFYINNIENSVSFDHAQENGDVTGLLYGFNPPRTYGVRLRVFFGAAGS